MKTLQTAWTQDELAANRRGELLASQVAKIRAGRWKLLVATAGVMFAVGIPLAMFLGAGENQHALMLTIGYFVSGLGAVIYLGRAAGRPFRERTLITLTGVLERSPIGHQQFRLDGQLVRPLYAGLERFVGANIAAYVLPKTKIVVAVEPAQLSQSSAPTPEKLNAT